MRGTFVSIAFSVVAGVVHARSNEHCAAAWASTDVGRRGFITRAEGARYFATIGAGDQAISEGRLSRDDFMRYCKAGLFDALHDVDGQGPLKGANSFTEGEARERVLRRGYRNVSQLHIDADGVWRGTAELNGIPVEVAVDYKGNVIPK